MKQERTFRITEDDLNDLDLLAWGLDRISTVLAYALGSAANEKHATDMVAVANDAITGTKNQILEKLEEMRKKVSA